jgi:gas vesicle protein
MAEVEYEGIKMSGSKMLFILPLLGTLIGGLWGGFELYNRLLEAEDTLANLKPEAIQKELVRLTELTEIIKTDLREDINVARDETQVAMDLARATEKTSADTQREIRNDVYAMERDMNNRFKEMDSETRELRKDLEDKIMTILENPLNDTE